MSEEEGINTPTPISVEISSKELTETHELYGHIKAKVEALTETQDRHQKKMDEISNKQASQTEAFNSMNDRFQSLEKTTYTSSKHTKEMFQIAKEDMEKSAKKVVEEGAKREQNLLQAVDEVKEAFNQSTETVKAEWKEALKEDQDNREQTQAKREMESSIVKRKKAEAIDEKKRFKKNILTGVLIMVIGTIVLSGLTAAVMSIRNSFHHENKIEAQKQEILDLKSRLNTNP